MLTSSTLIHCHAASTALMATTSPEAPMILMLSRLSVLPELCQVMNLVPSTKTSIVRVLV